MSKNHTTCLKYAAAFYLLKWTNWDCKLEPIHLTMSAPMPNRVMHASMCIWPNLTKHMTNPMCLQLLTFSAPTLNHVALVSICFACEA